jgi:hypothetical protein
MRTGWQGQAIEATRPQVSELLRSREFVAVVVFSAIGLLASVWLASLLPLVSDWPLYWLG